MIRFAVGTKPPQRNKKRKQVPSTVASDRSDRSARTNSTSTRSPTPHSPSHLAKESTEASVLSLHNRLQPTAEKAINQLIALFANEHRISENASKLAEPTFLPKSIRFRFNLNSSSYTTDSPIHHEYIATAKQIITDSQTRLKDVIVMNSDLDLKLVRELILRKTIEATAFLAKAFLLSKKLDISGFNCYYFFTYALNNTEFTQKLTSLGKRITDLSDGICIPTPTTVGEGEPPEYTALHREFQKIIKKLFIQSRLVFAEAISQQKLDSQLSVVTRLHESEKATVDAVELLDLEESVDAPTLNKLIVQRVNEQTSVIRKEFEKKLSSVVNGSGLKVSVKKASKSGSNTTAQSSGRNTDRLKNRNRQGDNKQSSTRDANNDTKNSGRRGKNVSKNNSGNSNASNRNNNNNTSRQTNKNSNGKSEAKNDTRGVTNTSRQQKNSTNTSGSGPLPKSKKRARPDADSTDDHDNASRKQNSGAGKKYFKKKKLSGGGKH
jgi:hypothetical protein